MDFDSDPCRVCGSEVELRAASGQVAAAEALDGPVGPQEGYVGDADSSPDQRVCTNRSCPTHDSDLEV